ncbi:Exocyst complex component 7 [Morus notabilis]|uniref:Exocyst subunit Exo70 family protein n=2 Tax=Morus notabilis TaxID=981085 RepID=W9QLB7_9ROSA|nr:Exocyst complex component 7 [Morus notabilis]
MEKSISFSKDGNRKNDTVGTPKHGSNDTADAKTLSESQIPGETEENDINIAEDHPSSESSTSLAQVVDEVDRFLQALSSTVEDESKYPEAPESVEILSTMVDSMITDYNDGKSLIRFGKDPENDSSFVEALNRVSELSNKLGEFPSLASSLNRMSAVLQRAMSFLDEEFRTLLEDWKSEKSKNNEENCNSDRCVLVDQNQQDHQSDQMEDQDQGIPPTFVFSPETVSKLNAIATAMISAGYEAECAMAYSVSRRSAFKSALDDLIGHECFSIDDVQRMHWEPLEGEIATWIAAVKSCSAVLLPNERSLCNAVFSSRPSSSHSLFGDTARAAVIKLLNFAEAMVLTKRSAEKLFKFLDMYETLRDLESSIGNDAGGSYPSEVAAETATVKAWIGAAAASIFCDLENSIKSDNGKTPVASGAVHPLTRYVMNYLKYACEYKDTLEQVFRQTDQEVKDDDDGDYHDHRDRDRESETSPFSRQLSTVMDLLDANLEMKSKLYRDPSLSFIFLMNNGRYIVQKIKGSSEIHQLMGDTWCRKRSSDLRQYHKNYQRETWGKVLQCLGQHDGLQVNGKVSKPVLKERFKSFNAMFDEIHKTQSTWVVSDEQLQSELRVSISAVMIPAYRSFLGRFKQYLDSGRQSEKYIKYQPEDIETLIDELFDGNSTSMARRRT